LCMAENATHSLHNVLTLRGAVVRDARAWSRYLDEALELFAKDSDVVFASHHWPTWGTDEILRFLCEQRDLYGYLHDQTLRMMNQGLTGIEIAEEMVLPPALQKAWHAQGYYGSVSHNVKAIYQRYLGWFDGNPAHLWEHPPKPAAERYVSCMGGVAEVISKAKEFTAKGDLRFAATLLNHAVYAEPENLDAREALASVFDRLGHGAENGIWRNFYLTGAQELRSGIKPAEIDLSGAEALKGLTVDQLLDSLAIRLHGPNSQGISMTIDLYLTDLKRQWRLTLSNGVLTHNSAPQEKARDKSAGLTCTLTRQQLLEVLTGKRELREIEQKGDPNLLAKLLSLLVTPNPIFPIITPRVASQGLK
jgi:alkyl sulfatase BDS1-like metallo-beta-lactamase superfamily hydrolase